MIPLNLLGFYHRKAYCCPTLQHAQTKLCYQASFKPKNQDLETPKLALSISFYYTTSIRKQKLVWVNCGTTGYHWWFIDLSQDLLVCAWYQLALLEARVLLQCFMHQICQASKEHRTILSKAWAVKHSHWGLQKNTKRGILKLFYYVWLVRLKTSKHLKSGLVLYCVTVSLSGPWQLWFLPLQAGTPPQLLKLSATFQLALVYRNKHHQFNLSILYS